MTSTQTELARTSEAQAPARSTTPQSVLDVFSSPAFKQQVAAALPRHIGVDSMMRIALTEVRLNPDLQKCTVASFMGALLKAAQAGLRPGMFGEGFIIPRWNGKLGAMEAQFQPGYMGLAQLAYRSGEVSEVHAVAVYSADYFRYQLGSDPKIEHEPDMDAEHRDEDIRAFYAVVKLVNGGTLLKVMRRSEVDDVRDRFAPRNKAGKLVGPWVSDFEPMGCKTVLIQALKLAPKDSERLAAALQAENDAVFGDRVAAGVVDSGRSVSERVAERIGAEPLTVDVVTGEVLAGEVVEDCAENAQEPQDGAAVSDEGSSRPGSQERTRKRQARRDQGAELAAREKSVSPSSATDGQLAMIAEKLEAADLYQAEFVAVLDSYGATSVEQLTEETAGYVISALEERGAR